MRSLPLLTLAAAVSSGCAHAPPAPPRPAVDFAGTHASDGVLVMAHGGTPEWNAAVALAVAPLRERIPTALALGMADPVTLQAGLDSLGERGVGRVAVVRLFLSGESFLHQTEFLLGLRSDPPPEPMLGHGGGHDGHGAPGLSSLDHSMEVVLGREGLGESGIAGRILGERVRDVLALSPGPARVLLLAHGMGAESENDEVLRHMGTAAAALRRPGVTEVKVATLREDWPEARARAEAEVRAWVGQGTDAHTVVVPFRLSGFGPYAQVLQGLRYRPTEGLLPHPLVAEWVAEQAFALLCSGDRSPAHCRVARSLP